MLTKIKEALSKSKDLRANFGMTEVEFQQILCQLKEGNESIFLQIFVTHFQECRYYLMNKFGVSKQQSYDLCMDTLVEFRNKLINNKIQYGNLRYLFTRMASNNYIDETKKVQKINSAIQVLTGENLTEESNSEQYFGILKRAISTLSVEQKKLVTEIFYSKKSMMEIAENNNVSYANLRKMKERVLAKLRISFFDLMKELN